MKRVVISLVVVLAVADALALWVYLQHKKAPAAAPAAAPVAAPAPAPEPEPVVDPAPASPLSQGARTPGGCQSPFECDQYCADAAHRQECLDFIGPAGVAAAQPPQTKDGDRGAQGAPPIGPGGCRTDAECNAYCEDPANGAACKDWASKERRRLAESVAAAPRSAQACISKRLGAKTFKLFLKARIEVTPKIGQLVSMCLSAGQAKGGGGKGSMKKTPGGCSDQASCTEHCMQPENREACLAWPDLPAQFREMLEKGGGGEGGGEGQQEGGGEDE